MKKTLWVMIQGLIQTLLVRLPLAYFMSIQPDASLTNIGLAAPVATCFGIILNIIFFHSHDKENEKGISKSMILSLEILFTSRYNAFYIL